MTFRLAFKTPDVLDQIEEQFQPADGTLDEHELAEDRREKAKRFAQGWLRYGEYVTIVFNTEQGTATVEHK